MYTSGVMTDLGPSGSSFSVGQAINDRGDVVGWTNAGLNIDHAFLYSAGVMTDLGTLAGFGTSLAFDINNAGQIVGSSEVANRESRGVLYENGALIDLDMLVDPASGWTIQVAYAINDQQQIAAWGCNGGVCEALRLDPVSAVPEPQTEAMLLAGLGLLGWTWRVRKTGIGARSPGNPGS
jgi:probable HAF family extracellular repeat protein